MLKWYSATSVHFSLVQSLTLPCPSLKSHSHLLSWVICTNNTIIAGTASCVEQPDWWTVSSPWPSDCSRHIHFIHPVLPNLHIISEFGLVFCKVACKSCQLRVAGFWAWFLNFSSAKTKLLTTGSGVCVAPHCQMRRKVCTPSPFNIYLFLFINNSQCTCILSLFFFFYQS